MNRAQVVPGENSAAAAAAAAPSFTYVILQYTESSAIKVRGPVTGREYGFSEAERDCAVDPRDAAVLTRSGLFRRAKIPAATTASEQVAGGRTPESARYW